ncbi:MAG: c-type cytochrome [Dehalococcoidia bacterium]|nr:c-type cytochrome [Dehalococcoidia bacterium]
MTTGHAQEQVRHPTFMQYVVVALILFLITIVEFYIIFPHQRITGLPLVVILVGLSAIKFAIVIFFYMHLKFDARLLTWIFLGGLALAFAVGLALLSLFGALRTEAQPRGFAREHRVPYVSDHGEDGAMEPKPGSGSMTGGDAEKLAQGKAVFTGKGTCFACHKIQGVSAGAVGPELTHIGTERAVHKAGMSSEAYIRESIEDPGAFVHPGFPPGVMPANLKTTLTADEFEALVAFLVAQK